MADPGRPIERLMSLIRAGIRTSVVGRVVSYQPGAPTATVEFLVQEERDLPSGRVPVPPLTVEGVPVLWLIAGGRGLTMGLREGDFVLVLYRHRSHDEVDDGKAVPGVPASCRRMNPSDVVAVPGFVAPETGLDAKFWRPDGQPVLGMPDDEAFHVGDSQAAFFIARADLVLPELQAIHGAVSGHEHLYTFPLHPAVGPQVSTAGGPVFAAPSSVATDRIKVDS